MDVEVDGILCPVGQVDVVPVALAGGGSFVLLTGHPDGKAGFVQLEPVERLGGFIEAQLPDKDFDAVGTVPEIDGGQTQRHEGQHTGQQSGRVFSWVRQTPAKTNRMAVKTSGRFQMRLC